MLFSGVQLTEIKEEEKEKIIEKLEEAIKALERLGMRVSEKTNRTENS